MVKNQEASGNPWATECLAKLGDAQAAMRVAEYYGNGSKSGWGMHQNEHKAEEFRQMALINKSL